MADDRFDFFGVQQIEHRAGKDDVTLAGNEKQRSIQLQTVLRLIERNGNIQLELGLRLRESGVEFRVPAGLQTVSGLEKIEPQVLGVIRLRLRRGEPIPKLPLHRLEVVPQLDMVRQWI